MKKRKKRQALWKDLKVIWERVLGMMGIKGECLNIWGSRVDR